MKALVFILYLFKDLRHNLPHSLLTVAGLAIMILSYLLTAALSEAFSALGSQPGFASHNLALLSADTIDPMQGSVSQAALDQAVASVQAAFGPGSVRRASPVIFRTLRILAGSDTRSMQVFAVDPQDMPELYQVVLLEGRYPTGSHEIAASQEAFGLAGWVVGQVIEFYGQQFTIVGKVQYQAGKIASLWMSYAAGENLFGAQRGFQIGIIQIAGNLNPETARAHLETVPGILPEYAVYLEQELYNRFTQAIHDILRFTIVLDALALLVISFGIFNAASLTLAERSREIALLRVAGFTARTIRHFLFGRTFLQTLVSYVLGWGLAEWVIRKHMGSSFSMHGAFVQISLSPANLFLGLALTILFAWFGVQLTTTSLARQSLAALLRD
ncbi:MAG: ABC transporter permease [Anaerolineales bacterium]|nr:ABC transporter permease [Anaerolineales bacterium]